MSDDSSYFEPPLPEGDEAPPPGVRAMAFVRWLLVISMALLASWSVARHFDLFTDTSAAHGVYTCPMHPEIVQEQPGHCPICSMDLVSKESASTPSAHAGEPVIELLGERAQRLGIKTAQVTRETRGLSVQAVGVIEVDESRVARVHARAEGYVEQLMVAKTFTRVSKGQPLFTLYSPQIVAAQRELLNAQKWQGQGPGNETLLGAARDKLLTLGLSDSDVESVLAHGAPQRALPIRAPIGGIVTRKQVVLGSFLAQGSELYEITDLSEVWLTAELPEGDASSLQVGNEAQIELPGDPNPRTGRIDLIYPTAESSRRSARVRIRLENKQLALRPGMTARVSLARSPVSGLFVEQSAVVDTGDAQYAFVARDATHYARVKVQAVPAGSGHVRVLTGLNEGDRVVVSATFLLDAETRLRTPLEPTEAASPEAGSAPHPHEGTP